MAAIETQQLAREFEGGIKAVDGVDLEVAEGEIYGFLGPNGAGKTTTVRMLTTLLQPDRRRARSSPAMTSRRTPAAVRRKIGVALQEAALDPLMTGRELLELQATLHGIPKAERRERGHWLLDRVGLTLAADRRVGTYSGGMRRRLDLASALIHRPRSSSWTSRPPASTPSAARRSGRRSASSTTRARPSFSPPSTWRRPTSSPTASGSSPEGGWSPRAPPAR